VTGRAPAFVQATGEADLEEVLASIPDPDRDAEIRQALKAGVDE